MIRITEVIDCPEMRRSTSLPRFDKEQLRRRKKEETAGTGSTTLTLNAGTVGRIHHTRAAADLGSVGADCQQPAIFRYSQYVQPNWHPHHFYNFQDLGDDPNGPRRRPRLSKTLGPVPGRSTQGHWTSGPQFLERPGRFVAKHWFLLFKVASGTAQYQFSLARPAVPSKAVAKRATAK